MAWDRTSRHFVPLLESSSEIRFDRASHRPDTLEMTHQVGRQEITRPHALDLPEHVFRRDPDVSRVDPWELGDFGGFFGEDRLEVGGGDRLAGVL